jgi:hypothetical protein
MHRGAAAISSAVVYLPSSSSLDLLAGVRSSLASTAAATGANRLRAVIIKEREAEAELHRVSSIDAPADALVAELRNVIEDLRKDRDHWREAFQQQQRLLQPGAQTMRKQRPIPASARRGLRKTG